MARRLDARAARIADTNAVLGRIRIVARHRLTAKSMTNYVATLPVSVSR